MSLKLLWRRWRTNLRLLLPRNRGAARRVFYAEPSLTYARHWADQGQLVGFQTLAGWYNDHTQGGNMTAELAKQIYMEGK